MRDLRAVVVKVVIVSFSLAALLGIATLLTGDALGETSDKVLGTTFVVGVESLAVLCYLAVAGTRRAYLGIVGGVISLVPFGLTVWIIWVDDIWWSDTLFRVLGIGLTLAASLAQASLLAAVADRPRPRVRGLLAVTFVAITALAALISYPIVTEAELGEWYFRTVGIVAILDVLGTILVIALQKFTAPRPAAPRSAEAAASMPRDRVLLPPDTEARLVEAARRRGTTPGLLLDDLLDDLLDPVPRA